MAIRAKFKGDGREFINGIPARDLSDEEYAALSTEQKHAVRYVKRSDGSALYDVRSDSKPAEPAKKEG